MRLRIILSAYIATVYGLPVNPTNEARIIGDSKATLGQFPYQAGIFFNIGSSRELCGGSLLNRRWVLTAGHCVWGARNFKVILGASELYRTQPSRRTFRVTEAHLHPGFNRPIRLNHDVALLKLDHDVDFDDHIRPIRLSNASDALSPNVSVVISGWGKKADSEKYVNTYLKYMQLRTIANDLCKRYFLDSLVPDYVVCAQGEGTQSPCNGDSGGPLVKTDVDGQPTQVAVFSYISMKGCGKGFPSGYSRIASFLPFIRQYARVVTN